MQKLVYTFIVMATQVTCYAQSFVNASVEAWAVPAVCETNTPPDGWIDYSNVGIGPDEGTLTICPSTIPPNAAAGNTYARCLAGNPITGEGMYQYVSGFTVGFIYTISYDYCGSNLWGGNADCIWHLFLDDIDINQSAVFSSLNSIWTTNYINFTASMTTHKIGVRAYTSVFGSPGSAAIDNFIITTSKPTATTDSFSESKSVVYPNPCSALLTINIRSSEGNCTFSLFEMTGRKIMQQEFSGSCTVNTGMLNTGIYFYELKSDARIIKRGNLIKK